MGPNPLFGTEKAVTRDHRMWLNGEITGNNEHCDKENIAKWKIKENAAQKGGILHNFLGLVVITLPRDPPYHIKATVVVKDYVRFFLNLPRILPKKDSPILLN